MPSWHYTTISMSMYEIGKFIVYKFTVHCVVYSKLLSCVVYSKLLSLTSLQVYTTSDSLQQIVGTYKSLTNQWAITLLQLMRVCLSTNQIAIVLFHCWWSVFRPIRWLLHFFTVVQPLRIEFLAWNWIMWYHMTIHHSP